MGPADIYEHKKDRDRTGTEFSFNQQKLFGTSSDQSQQAATLQTLADYKPQLKPNQSMIPSVSSKSNLNEAQGSINLNGSQPLSNE